MQPAAGGFFASRSPECAPGPSAPAPPLFPRAPASRAFPLYRTRDSQHLGIHADRWAHPRVHPYGRSSLPWDGLHGSHGERAARRDVAARRTHCAAFDAFDGNQAPEGAEAQEFRLPGENGAGAPGTSGSGATTSAGEERKPPDADHSPVDLPRRLQRAVRRAQAFTNEVLSDLRGDVLMDRLAARSVPWTLWSVAQVLFSWLVAFTCIGWWAVPWILGLTGQTRYTMSMRGQALLHLVLDVWQCIMTMFILWATLRQHKPLQLGIFPFSLKPRTWLPYVLLGLCSFPFIEGLSNIGADIFPDESEAWAHGLGETLLSCDPITAGSYFLVVAVCAPLWEEVMFRGFLMPSFAKYLKVPGAVVASAVLFSMAHFSLSRSLPLVLLGAVIGVLFAASRNLTTAVVLHSLWNFWVLITIGGRVA